MKDDVVVTLKRCTCAECYGEDPDCVLHGIATAWTRENTLAVDWQETLIEYRTMFKEAEKTLAAIPDFCSAVLADNRPRTGKPFDAIHASITLARKRAYDAGCQTAATEIEALRERVRELEGRDAK